LFLSAHKRKESVKIDSQADHARERLALFVATITSFMGPFTISSVNVALPVIQKEFGINAIELNWVATSFLLSIAVMLVPAGRIGDIHGRKKVFVGGLVVYTLASVIAVVSNSLAMLIFSRMMQGAGAAMFVATGLPIITSIFPSHKRGKAIGIYAGAVYIGLAVGPFVGGILTQHIGWRSIFVVVVFFGAASVYTTLRYIKGEWADAKGEPFDIIGSFLYGISILSLVYGASLLPNIHACYLFIVGGISLLAFIRRELVVEFPVFEVKLFSKNRLFTYSSLAALINYSATFAVTFLLSLYLQYIHGKPPQVAGLILVAQPVVMAIFSPIAGRLSDRIEPRKIASFGMGVTALGLFIFVFVGTDTSMLLIICNLMMLGFGFALFSSPNMSAIMGAVEKRQFGIASGSVATMRLLGQMISMAIAMVLFAVFIGQEKIAPSTYEQFLKAVKTSFMVSTVLCMIGVFFSLFRGKVRNFK
jgi:EmrB/QacA subfamily drug resistance transporter